METNPRVRMPAEWAPPPPVIVPERSPHEPPPIPPNQEEEFEDILGGLVEHYATLPPANFGEPPETIFEAKEETVSTRKKSSALLWIALGVGGFTVAALAAGGYYFWDQLKRSPAVIAADPAPAIKIAIKKMPPPRVVKTAEVTTPKVEPLPAAEAEAEATPQAEAPAPVAEIEVERSKPAKARVVKRAKRRPRHVVKRRTTRRRSSPRQPVRASTEDWEDPYK